MRSRSWLIPLDSLPSLSAIVNSTDSQKPRAWLWIPRLGAIRTSHGQLEWFWESFTYYTTTRDSIDEQIANSNRYTPSSVAWNWPEDKIPYVFHKHYYTRRRPEFSLFPIYIYSIPISSEANRHFSHCQLYYVCLLCLYIRSLISEKPWKCYGYLKMALKRRRKQK